MLRVFVVKTQVARESLGLFLSFGKKLLYDGIDPDRAFPQARKLC
jgi:hypothetical protein